MKRQLTTTIINGVMLCSMLLSLVAPFAYTSTHVAQAQETTEEPAPPTEPNTPEPVVDPTEVIETATTEAPPVETTEAPPVETTEAPPTETTAEPEATEAVEAAEPSPETTEDPTAESTEETAATEPAEATEEPTVEATEPAEVTQEPAPSETPPTPTDEPTEPAPDPDRFEDDFQDGDTVGWVIEPGWAITADNENLMLTGIIPDAAATVQAISWADLSLTARLRVQPENTAIITIRGEYDVKLDGAGLVTLQREDVVLAQGPAPAVEATDTAVWRKVSLQALSNIITVAVDDVTLFSFDDPAAYFSGAIAFKTDAVNTGAVNVDDVLIERLDAPTIIPTAEPTPEATAEITEEPETTEEPAAEATDEPEAEGTEEPNAEATEEPAPVEIVAVPVLIADFESELVNWIASDGAVIVAAGEGNQALLLNGGGSLLPAIELTLSDFRLEAQVQFLTDAAGGLNIPFHTSENGSYILSFEPGQTTLLRNNGETTETLAAMVATHDLNVWHALSLEVSGNAITVMVNDGLEIEYAGENALTAGSLALAATGETSLLLDKVAVYELIPQDLLVTPTPLPTYTLNEENATKLPDPLYQVLTLLEADDQAGALALAADLGVNILDDALSLDLVVWPATALDTAAVQAVVEQHGGVVTEVYEKNITAQVTLPNVVAVISTAEVLAVRLPEVAVSASSSLAPAQQPGLEPDYPDSLPIIGWNDWNQQSITGSGVRIGVIDTSTTSNHMNAVVNMIGFIAPNATVTRYAATTAAQLATRIGSARSADSDIILIAMDLGAQVSPGDGTGANGSAQSVYTQIQNAHNEGRLVVASAGNNNGRYESFNYTVQNTDVTITANQGAFVINVSWNDWAGSVNIRSDISGTGITATSSPATRVGDPGYQLAGTCSNPTCTINLNFGAPHSNPTGNIVQVQFLQPNVAAGAGTIDNVTGSAALTTTGNIARPADSPFAFAVGAVCPSQIDHFPIALDSSHGPIFGGGGSTPTGASQTAPRSSYKPDVVAPTHLWVNSTLGNPDFNCGTDNPATGGFNGTSASAAHVAGMAALLLSNNAMDDEIATNVNPAQAIKNYMQTHTVDLFAGAQKGFDQVYGAGLTILGDPDYDLSQVDNPLQTGGNAVYVSAANPNSNQSGTFDNPFIHAARAIEYAVDNTISRIVFLPGEYVTGFDITNLTNLSLESFNNQATFWVNNSFEDRAGIYIENSTQITMEGFTFNAANPADMPLWAVFRNYPAEFVRPQAIEFSNSTLTSADSSVVRDSIFTGFIDEAPVFVNRTYDLSFFDNTFTNIDTSGGQLNRAAMHITNSNPASDRLMLRGNTFTGIRGTVNVNPNREAIIRIENSAVDIFSNFFHDLNAETVLNILNDATDGTEQVNIFSNVFLRTQNLVLHMTEPAGGSGAAPQTRFINNTVALQNQVHNIDPAGEQALIRRTDGVDTTPFAVHNNLFYDNGASRVIHHAPSNSAFSFCRSIDQPAVNETGARNNWVIATQTGFGSGTCDKSFEELSVAQNDNILSDDLIDPVNIFSGAAPGFPLDPNNDPIYYQIIDGADGVDRGDIALLLPPNVDFSGNVRNADGNDDDVDEPDMGAFELVPLEAGPINITRSEDYFNNQDGLGNANDRSTAFAIDLRGAVAGGFAPFTFTVKTFPTNFSTDPSDFCLGAGLRIIDNFAYYCPPQHFYTDPTDSDPIIPDDVVFEYYAFDRTGDPTDPSEAPFNSVTLEIQPTVDSQLTDPIDYSYVVEAGAAITFRLRPYVRFNNFRFSELGTANTDQADYPFTPDSDITIVDFENPNILDHGGAGLESYIETQIQAADPNDGSIVLQTSPGERGFVEFTYSVTDSYSGGAGTVANTIRIIVTGLLPEKGLHDDASFNFTYNNLDGGDDAWQPITSTTSINNTLHRSRQLNDVAGFDFVGEGFVLYMQGVGREAQWELRVNNPNGEPLLDLEWVQQLDGSWIAERDGFTCSTRANISDNLITNRDRHLYTISCEGLRENEAHNIQVINRQGGRFVQVDAFSILFDADPLLPGFHEVTEHDIFTTFAGWATEINQSASNGRTLIQTSDGVSDTVFRFIGSGVAIGTTLERISDGVGGFVGADYDICITPQIDNIPREEVCQNFNNSLGAGRSATWNVFRSFSGYDYQPLAASPNVHQVRIKINDIPVGTRLVIDSITILGDQPVAPLDNRVTEDDMLGYIVTGNGMDDSWSLTTVDRQASNGSLTSLSRRVVAAGPYITFNVDDDIDLLHWYRRAASRDSHNILVCVDRAQGEVGITEHCQPYDLRTSPNPLLIRESDFGVAGWGTGWSDDVIHSVEIFSLVNESFNLDKIEIFDSTQPLEAGFYEDYVLSANSEAFGFYDTTGIDLTGSSVGIIQDRTTRRSSASSVARTDTANEGALFQMHGTGFTAYFTQDQLSGDVLICWDNTLTNNANTVEASGNCRTYTNYSGRTTYLVGHTVIGLPEDDYTVSIRNLQNPDRLTQRMMLDAFEISNDTLPTNILTGDSGTRFETSYDNRIEDDLFLYYGSDWSSVEGRRARAFSGENYDTIRNKPGAGLVFRVQNVDTLRIERTARRGYAAMEICVDGSAICRPIPGDLTPAVVHLSELVDSFNISEEHVISLVLTSNGTFNLDAIDIFDTSAPLLPARYEDDYPALKYDISWANRSSGTYSERHAQWSNENEATLLFHMYGSFVQIAAFVNQYEQMEVCYVSGIELDPAAVNANCNNFPVNNGQSLRGRHIFDSGALSGAPGNYTVRVRHNNPSQSTGNFLYIDYIQVMNDLEPLTVGRHEDNHPSLTNGTTGTWTTQFTRNASEGSYLRTQTAGDSIEFEFDGTGFGIGTFIDRFGSEMEICWDNGGVPECHTYQNEASRTSTLITRAITGLPDDTYTVTITNVNDGQTQLTDPPSARDIVTYPPTLVIDFVEIYDELPQILVAADRGTYNDDGADENGGEPLAQLLPTDGWVQFADRNARGATHESLFSVVDTRNRVTRNYAGQSVTFRTTVPASSDNALILDLYKAERNNATLQVCILNGMNLVGDCQVIDATTNRYHAITLDTAGTYSISISSLTPGYFRLDGFQFVEDNTLGGGRYEDVVINAIGDALITNDAWTSIVNRRASNSSTLQTIDVDDFLQFAFYGTGFSIGTETGRNGSEMLVCYLQSATPPGTWDGSGSQQCYEFQNEASRGSNNISRTIAGLPEATYQVGVVHLDDGNTQLTDPASPRDNVTYPATLTIDYVDIFADPLPPTISIGDGGNFNEDADDGSEAYMNLFPTERWTQLTERNARGASEESLYSVVDTRNRASAAYAGPAAVLRVEVAANDVATVTLDTYASGRNHSDQLLACIVGGSADDLLACNIITTMPDSEFQVATIDNTAIGTATEYSLFFQTLTPGYLRVDSFKVQHGATLSTGRYEDIHVQVDGLILRNPSVEWATVSNRAYTNGTIVSTTRADNDPNNSNVEGDFIRFVMQGTGFAIGTHVGRTGSEMRVCFVPEASYDDGGVNENFFDKLGEECIDFQNEASRTNRDVLRSVTGLPEDTYVVGVLNVDDGNSNLSDPPVARDNVTYPATLIIDFIDVYNEPALTSVTTAGVYNEDALDGSENPFIQLLPADNWTMVEGRSARLATEESYVGIADSRNRVTSRQIGGTATMQVQVPGSSSTTLALNIYRAERNNSDQLMACVLNGSNLVAITGDPDNPCAMLDTMQTNTYQVITIENSSGSPTDFTVFYQTLTQGFFRVDGFQVVNDGILTAGIFDNHFMADNGLIDLNGNWDLPPARGTKVRGTYGGEIIRTQDENANLIFHFTGSGISVVTHEDAYRLDLEVCFVPESVYVDETSFDDTDLAFCRLNSTELTRGSHTQYGVNFYGLTPDTYAVRVQVNEVPTDLVREWFKVDAIAIFDSVTDGAALQNGMYDDAELLDHEAVRFAPADFWSPKSRVRSGPPRGPWQLTQQEATNAGSIVQLFVEGNVLILYQEFSGRNSGDVQLCIVVEGSDDNELLCNNFSQRGRGGYLTPVAFYGLGEGQHELIFENKAPRQPFTVDAIQVTP